MTKTGTFDIDLRLPARSGLEVVAAETGAAMAIWGDADESTAGDIRLALIEGCINAMEHAYRQDCEHPVVQLRFRLTLASEEAPTTLKIWIQDSGKGFDINQYKEPILEEKLHSPVKRGWGLKLIRGFMDEIQIISGQSGTTIEMTKILSS